METTAGRAVLRLSIPQPEWLGVDREREARILQALSGKPYVPTLWYHQPESGIQVVTYEEGQVFNAQSLPQKHHQTLLDIISDFQQSPIDLPRMNYYEYLQRYWQNASPSGLIGPDWHEEWRTFLPLLKGFQESPWKPVLCHHDLNGFNLVVNDHQMILLDWEYAAMGHPFVDNKMLGEQYVQSSNYGEGEPFLDDILIWLDRLWEVLNISQKSS